MFGSSSGEPYWHQATASLPSKTRAACAWPSRTRRSFQGRPFSPSGLPSREWNHVHQQPPNPAPLCLSSKRAYASHVEASSALISYSLIAPPRDRDRPVNERGVYVPPAEAGPASSQLQTSDPSLRRRRSSSLRALTRCP